MKAPLAVANSTAYTSTSTTTTTVIPTSRVTNVANTVIYRPPHVRSAKSDLLAIKMKPVINRDAIVRFVKTSLLFRPVIEKGAAIERLNKVANKPETVEKLNRLALLFNRRPKTNTDFIADPLFSDQDFEDLVVLTHLARQINYSQLATAFYRKAILDDYGSIPLQEVPLFLPDGKINPEARQIIKLILKTPTAPRNPASQVMEKLREETKTQQTPTHAAMILQDHEIDRWFLHMQSAPASERMLLIGEMRFEGVQAINTFKENWANSEIESQERLNMFQEAYQATIMDALYAARSNLFNRVRVSVDGAKDALYRIFPSIEMAKTLFRMQGDHCHLLFRFGIIDTHSSGKRNIALPSSYQTLPTRVEGFRAAPHDHTSYNLCCNAYLASLIPEEEQTMFNEIGDTFVQESRKRNNPYMQFIADRCYNMNTPLYRPEMQGEIRDSMLLLRKLGAEEWNNEARFVHSLFRFIPSAIERRLMSQMETIYEREGISDARKDELASRLLDESVGESIASLKVCAFGIFISHFLGKAKLTPFEQNVLALLRIMFTVGVP